MTIRSYAQNFEDVILWRAFSDVSEGFFIDVGAQHPVQDSVSRAFSDHNWRGIHVEPMPAFAQLLRADRPHDIVIQAALSDSRGMTEFHAFEGTGLSTGCKDIADRHAEDGFGRHLILTPTITLDDVFDLVTGENVHWLKIDVEGMEKIALQGWVTSARRPWVVLVEATMPRQQVPTFHEWEKILVQKGYSHVYSDGLNRFYLWEEKKDLRKHFTSPVNIFDEFQLAQSSHFVSGLVQDYEARLSDQRTQGEQARQEVEHKWRDQVDGAVASARAEADAREVALHTAHATVMLEQSGAFRAALDRAGQELQAHRMQVCALEAAVSEQRANNAALAADLDASQAALSLTRAHLGAIFESRSWRLAKPIRMIFGDPASLHVAIHGGASSSSEVHGNGTGQVEEATKAVTCTAANTGDQVISNGQKEQTLISLLSLPLPDFIRQTYCILLGRSPTEDEVRAQSGVLALGLGRTAFLADISKSAEFRTREHQLMMQGNDMSFLQYVYWRYLDREPDELGSRHYLVKLVGGKKRQSIVRAISQSTEARIRSTQRYGLERIIAVELRARHWLYRWFVPVRLLTRRTGISVEILNYSVNNSVQQQRRALQAEQAGSPRDVHEAATPELDMSPAAALNFAN